MSNGISIFLISNPSQIEPKPEEEKQSKLVEALRRKREDEKHAQMIQKMEQITRGIGNLPHMEHSAGGTG